MGLARRESDLYLCTEHWSDTSICLPQLGSMNEPNNLYSVTTTSGSAGVAVIELPVSSS